MKLGFTQKSETSKIGPLSLCSRTWLIFVRTDKVDGGDYNH